MEEEIRQLAARIKEIREIEGVTPEQLAADLEITPELYLNYEKRRGGYSGGGLVPDCAPV